MQCGLSNAVNVQRYNVCEKLSSDFHAASAGQ